MDEHFMNIWAKVLLLNSLKWKNIFKKTGNLGLCSFFLMPLLSKFCKVLGIGTPTYIGYSSVATDLMSFDSGAQPSSGRTVLSQSS